MGEGHGPGKKKGIGDILTAGVSFVKAGNRSQWSLKNKGGLLNMSIGWRAGTSLALITSIAT